MGGAVTKIIDFTTDPGGLFKKATGVSLHDPLGLMAGPEEAAAVPESAAGLSDAEKANLAAEEAKRKSKKQSAGTKTVLTSPLGATTTAKTAVTKLGGA